MRHERVPIECAAEWKAALAGVPHGFGHTWESCYAMSLTSGSPTFLYRVSSARARLVCPLAERVWEGHRDLMSPYGFSGFTGEGDRGEGPAHLAEFARREGYVCGYVVPNPALHPDAAPADSQASRHVYVVDLRATEAELFARLDENRRRQVRSFERSKGVVTCERSALREFFMNRFADFMREKGAGPVYRFSEATLAYLLELDNVLLVGAGVSTISAVSVFGYTAFSADYLFNVSSGEGQRYSAVLLWSALKRFRELGVASLNLGGGVREGDGVAAFKERFGGRRIPLLPLRQVYRPALFADLCHRAGVDPAAPGYFPPYQDPALRDGGGRRPG